MLMPRRQGVKSEECFAFLFVVPGSSSKNSGRNDFDYRETMTLLDKTVAFRLRE